MTTLEEQIQTVLNDYRPNLYMDGGDVEVLQVDEKGIVHLKMMGACIDCPISLLTMKLGIQRLLKEKFPENVKGVNAITDVDLSALYNRGDAAQAGHGTVATATPTATPTMTQERPAPMIFSSRAPVPAA